MAINDYYSTHKTNIFVFGLYFILTLLMVWLPLSIDLRTTYIGHGEVVWWSNLFWWADYAVTHFINPLHNNWVFYPLGMDMVDSIFPVFVFIPITHVFGSILSYNLYVLSTFFLAGYGMYILSIYIYKNEYVAFILGLIFAFFPFHFGASLGHLHTFSIMWIPFFAYFFLKMYDRPKNVNIFFASLFFAINALTSWSIAVMLTIFCIVYSISYRKKSFSKNFYPKLLIFALVSICLIVPGLFLIVKNIATNENMILPLTSFIEYSADFIGFFLPSPFHPILGDISNHFYTKFTGNYSENIVSIGYTVILMTLLGAYSYRKEKFNQFAIFCFILFFVLSLGPVLHVFGQIYFTEENLTIMLPGIICKYIPVLNMIRVPSRYDIMIMFSISLISGYGLKYLFEKVTNTNKDKVILCCLISCLILFEFMAVLPTQDIKETPDFYYTIGENGSGSIIEVPIIRSPLDSPGGPTMMYYYEYQKVHSQPIIGGYFNRINVVYADFINQDPILKPFFNAPTKDITKDPDFNPSYLINNYDVSHVIIHEDFLTKEEIASYRKYLGNEYIYDNSVTSDKLIIYDLNKISTKPTSYVPLSINLGERWHGLETWDNVPSRWILNNATLEVSTDKNENYNLSFNAISFAYPRTLAIYANGKLQHEIMVPTKLIEIQTPILLHEGNNNMTFYVLEGTDKPSAFEGSDSRDISIGFQNISIS